jgi:hypothetical protein
MIDWVNRVALEVAEKHGACVLWLVGPGRDSDAVTEARLELAHRIREGIVYYDPYGNVNKRVYAERGKEPALPGGEQWKPVSTVTIGDFLGMDHSAIVVMCSREWANRTNRRRRAKNNGRIESANEGVQAVRQEEEHEALSG